MVNLSRGACPQAIDFTILDPWAYVEDALSTGAGYLEKHGDDAKSKKHALHVQAAGARFLSASFSVLGAWGPAFRPSGASSTRSGLRRSRRPRTLGIPSGLSSSVSSSAVPESPSRSCVPMPRWSSPARASRALSARLMRIVPAFPISPLIEIPSKFLTTGATSLTAVPSVLHVMAHRRVTCEFPGGLS
eukprot:scaffold4839_cov136-Isochrysis_galbana.AAC.1